MTNTKTTKRALMMSVVSLFLCFTMLLGTTYAWFTDSVTSSGNKIMAGTLDVQLFMHTENGATEITNESAPIFGPGSLAMDNAAETLWEPGKTQVVYFSIKNNGTLALKYKVDLIVTAIEKNLNEALVYTITPDAEYGEINADNWDDAGVKQVVGGINAQTDESVALAPQTEHFFALAVHMLEEAGNEYQEGSITFDMVVLASQLASEADSFGPDYDVDATFPTVGYGNGSLDALGAYVEFALYDKAFDDHNKQKVANVKAPLLALADPEKPMSSTLLASSTVYEGVVVAADQRAQTFEISVSNIVEGNTTPVEYSIRVGTGLTGIKVYHYGNEIGYEYKNGYVIFSVTEFSPFTIVYDAEVVENEDDNTGTNGDTTFPVAEVSRLTETDQAVVDFEWTVAPGSASQLLDAIYSFKAPHDSETVELNAYKDWYCDYYVMVETADEDFTLLPEGSITLGGNYGGYLWVGFDNPEVGTNEWFPLLGSVGMLLGEAEGDDSQIDTYWTYETIVKQVGEFLCGVAIADGADPEIAAALCDGARFIVELRLTNNENTAEQYVTNRVIYNFADGTSTIYPENN